MDKDFECEENEEDTTELPKVNYDFYTMDINELAVRAKNDEEAMNEMLYRVDNIVQAFVKGCYRLNRFIDYEDVYISMQKVVLRAVEIYQREKGDFLFLLRKMLFLSERSAVAKQSVRYYREIKYYGRKIPVESSDMALFDSGVDEKNKIQDRIDLENFLLTLTEEQKKILLSYLSGATIRELSIHMSLPYTTTAYKLRQILKSFDEMMNGKREK